MPPDAAGIGVAAALFALVNLLNLLPMPPFDGGNVAKAIFRSLKWQNVVMTGWALVVLGSAGSVYQGTLTFGIGIAITAFLIADLRVDAAEHTAMSKLDVSMMLSGTILTGAIYGAILYNTLQDSGISQLIEAI